MQGHHAEAGRTKVNRNSGGLAPELPRSPIRMLVAHEQMASHSASALVSRPGIERIASQPVMAKPWPIAECLTNANHHVAIYAFVGMDTRPGGEGKASKQLATGAHLLPATASTGTTKSRLRRPRIPSP